MAAPTLEIRAGFTICENVVGIASTSSYADMDRVDRLSVYNSPRVVVVQLDHVGAVVVDAIVSAGCEYRFR